MVMIPMMGVMGAIVAMTGVMAILSVVWAYFSPNNPLEVVISQFIGFYHDISQ